MRPSPLKEADITRQIRDVLKWLKIPHRKIWQGPMSGRGIADIIGCLPPHGKYFAIEVKRPGEKPTKWQREFLREMEQAGGIAVVAHCIEDVMEGLGLEGMKFGPLFEKRAAQ